MRAAIIARWKQAISGRELKARAQRLRQRTLHHRGLQVAEPDHEPEGEVEQFSRRTGERAAGERAAGERPGGEHQEASG